MIFDLIIKAIIYYKRLLSYRFLRPFKPLIKAFVVYRTRKNIENFIKSTHSLEVILREYAIFIDSFHIAYNNDDKSNFSITYKKDTFISQKTKRVIKYISAVNCSINTSDDLTIIIHCEYKINEYGVMIDGDFNTNISFKDNKSGYNMVRNGITEFYYDLYEYILKNTIIDMRSILSWASDSLFE